MSLAAVMVVVSVLCVTLGAVLTTSSEWSAAYLRESVKGAPLRVLLGERRVVAFLRIVIGPLLAIGGAVSALYWQAQLLG